MNWYIEKHRYDVTDEGGKITGERIKYCYPYSAEHPKKTSLKNVTMVEVPSRPSRLHEAVFDGTKFIEWKIPDKEYVDKVLRPKRNVQLQKILDVIDQYRNEKDMVTLGIIPEVTITTKQRQKGLEYLQALKDVTEKATVDTELPPVPEEIKDLLE